MNDDGPEITPQVLHLRDLLKWVSQGRIAVPRFQRDFVWDRPKMVQLFDSLRRQYPVGTILLWETTESIPYSDYFGPLRLPSAKMPPLLVLDGQQRLTTLAGVLLFEGKSAYPEEADPERWNLHYDAEADTFCHLRPNRKAKVSVFPVRDLMTTEGLFQAAQKLMSASAPPQPAEWLKRLQAVSNALSSYRIPLVIFKTNSLDLAVDSFVRVNRAGQTVSADEMVSALTHRDDFHLSNRIDEILTNLNNSGFGQVDRMLILRPILVSIGLDPFKTEWHQLTQEKRAAANTQLPQAVADIHQPLQAALNFLKDEGIETSCLLPYGVLLTGLTLFYWNDRQATPEQETWLRRWLWVSSFTGAYGTTNVSRIRRILEGLKNDPIKVQQDLELNSCALPFPSRHDLRSARVRALLVALLPSDPRLRAELTEQLRKAGPDAYLKITQNSPSPANRLLAVTEGQTAKKFLLNLEPEHYDDYLVDRSALNALEEDRDSEFLVIRQQLMANKERSFMELKGVTPSSESPAPAPLDAET